MGGVAKSGVPNGPNLPVFNDLCVDKCRLTCLSLAFSFSNVCTYLVELTVCTSLLEKLQYE